MPWFFDGKIQPEVSNVNDPTFRPRLEASKSIVAISQVTDTSIFTFSGEGVIQAFTINFNKADVDVILKVDGVETFRIDLPGLGTVSEYNMGDFSKNGPFPVRTNGADSQIIVDFGAQTAGFTSSFQVLARALTTNVNKLAFLCSYREKT